nr:MAG TPA: hypothetical protein [Caudoviricetes sp.]
MRRTRTTFAMSTRTGARTTTMRTIRWASRRDLREILGPEQVTKVKPRPKT